MWGAEGAGNCGLFVGLESSGLESKGLGFKVLVFKVLRFRNYVSRFRPELFPWLRSPLRSSAANLSDCQGFGAEGLASRV